MPAQYGVFLDLDNNGTYLGTGENVTARVLGDRGVAMERGRDHLRALAPPMAGRLEFALDNRSRDYSAKNTSSPIYTTLRPGLRATVTAQDPSTALTHILNTALVDDIAQEPSLGSRSVRLPCLGMLSRLAGKTVTTALYEGITTGTAIGAVLDAAGWPATERSIQAGQTNLAWWWLEDVDAFEALRTLLNTEGPGAALYERGDGYLVFEDRHYRVLTTRATTSRGTFRDSGTGPWHREPFSLNPNLKGVINQAEIAVNVRTPQALAEIWTLGQSLQMAPSSTIKLAVTAASGEPFRGAVVPGLTTDYTLLAGTATLTLDRTSGLSVTLTVTAGAAGATITGLRLRAQALPATTVRVVNVTDTSASRTKYGTQTWNEPVWPEIDINLAQELCNAIVQSYREPRSSARITIEGADAAMLTHCLTREISDRVTVIEAQTGLNSAMHIEHIAHQIGTAGRHVTTLGLEEVVAGMLPALWNSGTWNFATWGY